MGSAPTLAIGVAIGVALIAESLMLNAEGRVSVETSRKGPLSFAALVKVSIAARVQSITKAALVAVSAVVVGTG